MTNWSVLIDSRTIDEVIVMKQFAEGFIPARKVVNHLKFTDAAGEFRRLERKHGTQKARTLAKRALNRRGYR
jgi:hypothetical protein